MKKRTWGRKTFLQPRDGWLVCFFHELDFKRAQFDDAVLLRSKQGSDPLKANKPALRCNRYIKPL